MKQKSTTTKVTLRKKKISKGRVSLYLDFYPAITDPKTGEETRREFLKMYLYEKPKEPVDKQHNKETEDLAKSIRQKKEIQLNRSEIYSVLELKQLKEHEAEETRGGQCFLAYFKTLTNRRKASNYDNWVSAQYFLEQFTGGTLKFADLTEKWCNDFSYYLSTAKGKKRKTTLSVNTTVSYFNKIKAALKQAYKDGLLKEDLNRKIESIKTEETQRQYLSLEELNQLVKKDCAIPDLKKAALFSALTGLRYSDIEKMRWEEINYSEEGGYYIQFRQQKTKGAEVMPISEQAFGLLGERKQSNDKIFNGIKYSAHQNDILHDWVKAAKIKKHITFHSFRHTYATLLLSKGIAMATVSKMLGHREMKTTQIYAKVIDASKREAADKIHLDF